MSECIRLLSVFGSKRLRQLSEEDRKLSSKIHVVKEKTMYEERGDEEKTHAMKKDHIAKKFAAPGGAHCLSCQTRPL